MDGWSERREEMDRGRGLEEESVTKIRDRRRGRGTRECGRKEGRQGGGGVENRERERD